MMEISEATERLEYLKAKAQVALEQEIPEWVAEDILGTIEAYDMAIEALRKTENCSEKPNNCTEPQKPSDDDETIQAIAHLQKVGWLQEHDRALTEPQRGCDADCNEDCTECAKEWQDWKDQMWTEAVEASKTEPQIDCPWK